MKEGKLFFKYGEIPLYEKYADNTILCMGKSMGVLLKKLSFYGSRMQWTKEQQAAIDTRGCDLLVAAAAARETAVLLERIVKMITDTSTPVDIDSLLVVTFTNAAAAEMRERLGDAIAKKLEESPRNIHLQKQLTLLNRASISTIHSFCLEIIRNHFHLLDIDPSFRIANEGEMLLLKADLIETLFEDFMSRKTKAFIP